jgi:hypothetical protein
MTLLECPTDFMGPHVCAVNSALGSFGKIALLLGVLGVFASVLGHAEVPAVPVRKLRAPSSNL